MLRKSDAAKLRVTHFLIGGEQGEGFLYHRLKGKVVQLVMPSAVRAAIAAWMMA